MTTMKRTTVKKMIKNWSNEVCWLAVMTDSSQGAVAINLDYLQVAEAAAGWISSSSALTSRVKSFLFSFFQKKRGLLQNFRNVNSLWECFSPFRRVWSVFIVHLLRTFRVAMIFSAEPLYLLSCDYQHFQSITWFVQALYKQSGYLMSQLLFFK